MNEVLDVVKNGLAAQEEKLSTELTRLEKKMDEQHTLNGETLEETKNQYSNIEKKLLEIKERQDEMEKKAGRINGQPRGNNFKTIIKDALIENKDNIEQLQSIGRSFEMQTKAIISETDAFTDDVVMPDYVPGIKYNPERRVRVRQFLPQGTTDSNIVSHLLESNFTDNTAVTAEGDASGQNDFDLTETRTSVDKIAAHFRVTKEALNDLSQLASHISLRGTEKYMTEEDAYLLYDSTVGLNITSTDYTLDSYTGDSNAQEYDVLLEGIKQIRNRNYMPTAAMVSISRYFDMIRRKDADGRYIFPNEVVFGSAVPRVLGVPIIATNAINDTDGDADDFLIADFPQLTTLFDREGMSVRFYEQDQDNVTKDLVTVQISGRLALPTYLPNAGAFGNFTTAITNAGNS